MTSNLTAPFQERFFFDMRPPAICFPFPSIGLPERPTTLQRKQNQNPIFPNHVQIHSHFRRPSKTIHITNEDQKGSAKQDVQSTCLHERTVFCSQNRLKYSCYVTSLCPGDKTKKALTHSYQVLSVVWGGIEPPTQGF